MSRTPSNCARPSDAKGAARLDGGEELVDLALSGDDHRHELLREHVERVARHARRLDGPLLHRLRDGGARQQVAPVLREDDPARDGVDLMARPADPLHAARDRGRGLDLDHEVDGTHVDPELERGGGDERGQAAGLERVFDLEPLLAGDRAVVGAGDRLARQLVERGRQTLGEPPAVDEHDRRTVRPHQLEQARMDRRPDRAAREGIGGHLAEGVADCRRERLSEPRHVLDRHLDAQVEGLLRSGVDDRDRPRLPRAQALAAAQEARDLLERALRRREPDPLRRPACGLGQALEREREMRAALRPDDGVDLVDDHRVDGGEQRPCARREQQEERLGRRDQDVGRPPQHRLPLALGRVAGADRDLREVHGLAAPARHARDAAERRAQVPLDVDRERLQGRDVEDTAALRLGRSGREHHAIDRRQEGRQGLARAGRARRRAHSRRARWRPSRGAGPSWAPRRSRRTTRGRPARTAARSPWGSPAHHRGAASAFGSFRTGPAAWRRLGTRPGCRAARAAARASLLRGE